MNAAMASHVEAHNDPARQAPARPSSESTTGRLDDALTESRPGGHLVDVLFELQRTGGNRQVQQVIAQLRQAPGRPPVIQPKLVVGPADDAYEREADRIAQLVGGGAPHDDRAAGVHRMTATGGGGPAADDVQRAVGRARGGGQPLPDEPRRALERTFGADFGGVRLHTDRRADQLNQALQSRAFTVGQDIFFRRVDSDTASPGGRRLLAHELTHVVQQQGGGMNSSPSHVIQRELTDEARAVLEAANSDDEPFFTLLVGGKIEVITFLEKCDAIRAAHLKQTMKLPRGAPLGLERFVQACLLKYLVRRFVAETRPGDEKVALKLIMTEISAIKESLKGAGFKAGAITPDLRLMLTASFGTLDFEAHGLQAAATVGIEKLEVCATYIPGRRLDALMRAHSFILYTDKQGQMKFISAHDDGHGILRTENDAWSPAVFSDPGLTRHVVATGNEAAAAFPKMLKAAKRINGASLDYRLIDQNCNSAAHFLLTSANLKENALDRAS